MTEETLETGKRSGLGLLLGIGGLILTRNPRRALFMNGCFVLRHD